MDKIDTYLKNEHPQGGDAITVFQSDTETGFCLADGAGGITGGALASEMAVQEAQGILKTENIKSTDDFEAAIRALDCKLLTHPQCGETTLIAGKIRDNQIMGASIGDSKCWAFYDDFDLELTAFQTRKPLLGSGKAIPIAFGPLDIPLCLVLGSDGLFNFSDLKRIRERALTFSVNTAVYIASLSKNESGAYNDDISVITIKR